MNAKSIRHICYTFIAMTLFALTSHAQTFALTSHAQTGGNSTTMSHETAIKTMEGLMMLHALDQKCPFPKNYSTSFEIVAMSTASRTPPISKEETATVGKAVEAQVNLLLATRRDETCKKGQLIVQAAIQELHKAQNKLPTTSEPVKTSVSEVSKSDVKSVVVTPKDVAPKSEVQMKNRASMANLDARECLKYEDMKTAMACAEKYR